MYGVERCLLILPPLRPQSETISNNRPRTPAMSTRKWNPNRTCVTIQIVVRHSPSSHMKSIWPSPTGDLSPAPTASRVFFADTGQLVNQSLHAKTELVSESNQYGPLGEITQEDSSSLPSKYDRN